MADQGTSGWQPPTAPPTDWPTAPPADGPAPAARRRRWPLVAGVVVFVGAGLATGAIVLTAGGDDDEAYCEALDDRARSDEPLIAFLDPDVTEDQVAEVRAWLEDVEGVTDLEYTDQNEAYIEAQELFADDQRTLDMLRREDIPPSFRFSVPDGMAAVDVEADLHDIDGVYSVERPQMVLGRTVLEVAEMTSRDLVEGDLGLFGSWIDPDVASELRDTVPGAVEEDLETLLDTLADDDGEIDTRVQRAAETIIDDAEDRCAAAG